MKNWGEKIYGFVSQNAIVLAVILSALIIAISAPVYFRQYDSKDQDAYASAHAHGFAMTNFVASSWRNPIIAKEIDLPDGVIKDYNHWPNGFFAVFALAIKIFGNNEITGRSFAIILNLAGLFLLAAAFARKNKIVYLAVPFILLSRIGRDAVPFVFLDAAFFLFLGLIVYAVSLLDEEKNHKKAKNIFWIASLVGPFFCQLIVIFSLLAAPVFYYFDRDKKKLAINLLLPFLATVTAISGMSFAGQGFLSGFFEPWKQFLHRASFHERYSEYVSFFSLFKTIGKHWLLNLNFLAILIPFAWWSLFKRKNPLAYFLPAALIYSLVMRNYVGVHFFAGLPVTAAAVFTVIVALAAWLEKKNLGILFLILLIISAAGAAMVPEKYRLYENIKQQRDVYAALADSPEVQVCRSFKITASDGQEVDYRLAEFFLGPIIIEKINKGETGKNCLAQVDFAAGQFSIIEKQ
jgi:hypothetical protein